MMGYNARKWRLPCWRRRCFIKSLTLLLLLRCLNRTDAQFRLDRGIHGFQAGACDGPGRFGIGLISLSLKSVTLKPDSTVTSTRFKYQRPISLRRIVSKQTLFASLRVGDDPGCLVAIHASKYEMRSIG